LVTRIAPTKFGVGVVVGVVVGMVVTVGVGVYVESVSV
jgi:hypothetical protein